MAKKEQGARLRKPILRGSSCGVNSPIIQKKARQHLRRKKSITTLGKEQEGTKPKQWNPDVETARKIFPD